MKFSKIGKHTIRCVISEQMWWAEERKRKKEKQ